MGTESEAMQPMMVDKPDLVISKSDGVIKFLSDVSTSGVAGSASKGGTGTYRKL